MYLIGLKRGLGTQRVEKNRNYFRQKTVSECVIFCDVRM